MYLYGNSMGMHTEFRKTADGSATLYVPELNEHYHSTHGAVQESKYVFIQMGLDQLDLPEINILEMGFGTGLNALLSLQEAGPNQCILYHTLEKYPLEWEQVSGMDYAGFLRLNSTDEQSFAEMHRSAWGADLSLGNYFRFTKEQIDLQDFTSDRRFDLIYFDAFAPDVQPELWSEEIFQKLAGLMRKDGILVTYCAKGEVRRRMERTGLIVERLPGPPGKREMLRATKK